MKKQRAWIWVGLLWIFTGCSQQHIDYRLVLSEESVSMVESESVEIGCLVYGNEELTDIPCTIQSSDETIVDIEDGQLKGIVPGTATVTFSVETHPELIGEVVITVRSSLEISPFPIDLTLFVGEETILNVTDHVDKTGLGVIWSSQHPEIASVENGRIKGLSEGTVTITATSRTSGKSIHSTVVVKANELELNISESSIDMLIDEERAMNIEVLKNGSPMDPNLIHHFDNEGIVKIEGSFLVALKSGVVEWTIRLEDDPEIAKQVIITVRSAMEFVNEQQMYSVYVNDTLVWEVIDRTDTTGLGVSWKSSDISILTVNANGTIFAKKTGIVTITATSKTSGKEIMKEITVIERPILDILVDFPTDTIEVETTFSLIANVNPSNANQGVFWETSNEAVATVDTNGLVRTHRAGWVTITATSKVDPTKAIAVSFEVIADPMALFERFHIEQPIRQYVTTFGYNPDRRYQWVNGSVTRIFFSDMNLEQRIVPITPNPYQGQVATPAMLALAEPMKLVRSGIRHEETRYIIYHDTGNHTPGAGALMHANYMVGADNANNRARSWHYTVDQNIVIQHIPDQEVAWQGDSFTAYGMGIGIETAVDFGSDLYTTWQRTAKLIASLLVKYDLPMQSILQHYNTSGKNCPQTLRMSGLYDHAIDLVQAETILLRDLSDYQIEFTSLNPEYVDTRGRVINVPDTAMRVGYQIRISGLGSVQSKVFYSVLPGIDGSTTATEEGSEQDWKDATTVDAMIASLPKTVVLSDLDAIERVRQEYNSLNPVARSLVIGVGLLRSKETALLRLQAVSTPVVIRQIIGDNSLLKHGFIELYNSTNQDISLDGWTIQSASSDGAFTLDPALEGLSWIEFGLGTQIKARSSFLIQTNPNGNNEGVYLPLPDFLCDMRIQESGKIVLTNARGVVSLPSDAHVVDFVGYGGANQFEGTSPAVNLESSFSLNRIESIDSNDNQRDFIKDTINPLNSRNDVVDRNPTLEKVRAMEVDLLILALPMTMGLDDQTRLLFARSAYDDLNPAEKSLVTLLNKLTHLEIELEGILHPNLAFINQAIASVPTRIVNDFVFPTDNGVSWSYKEGEDSSYFDLENGRYLKLSLETKLITLIASCNEDSKEVVVNFGVAGSQDQIVYSTGGKAPLAGGKQRMAKEPTGNNSLTPVSVESPYRLMERCSSSV